MGENIVDECASFGQFPIPVVAGEYGRTYRPAQARFRVGQGSGEFQIIDITDDQQVDIASGPRGASRGGTVYPGEFDLVAIREQCAADHVGDAERLPHQRLDLGKDRRLARGLEIALPALHLSFHQAARDQGGKLALHGALACSCFADDLVEIEAGIGFAKKQPEYALSGAPEKGVADRECWN